MPVVVVARTDEDLTAVGQEIQTGGGLSAACKGDVADAATAAQAVRLADERGWWINHLVCNAGIGKSGPTESFDPNSWRRIFDVNVHGAFAFIQACVPAMLTRSTGTISIISSIAGLRGVPYDVAYSASKHALVGIARSLAIEYRKRGVSVYALCPSYVESEMTQRTVRGMMKRRSLTEVEARQRIADKTPSKRIISAEEIGEVIVNLTSGDIDLARHIAKSGGYPIIPEPSDEEDV